MFPSFLPAIHCKLDASTIYYSVSVEKKSWPEGSGLFIASHTEIHGRIFQKGELYLLHFERDQ